VLFALAAAAWVGRHRLARSLSGSESARARGAGARAAFALGAGIMAVELPTAFPYFGALAAVIGSGASLVAQLLLVVVFNLAFVLPLLAIVGLRVAAGERAEQRLAAARGGLARHAGAVLAALLGAGGIALVAVGLGAG
jgi:cytochrome c biogenesis protein CcdA